MKKINISKGTKSSVAFAISSFISKGMGIISIPFFTRLLTAEEMGIYTTFISWQGILEVITTVGLLSGSFNVGLMTYENNRKDYLSWMLTLSSFFCLAYIGVVCIFRKSIINIMGLPFWIILYMLLYLFVSPALNFWMLKERFEYKYKKVTIISVFSSIVSTILSILLIYFANQRCAQINLGYVRIIGSNIISLIICFIIYIYIMIQGKTHVNIIVWKNALKLSFPLMIHTLAKQILDLSDRTMIAKFCGNREVGIYGVLYSVSALSLILWNSINASLIPFIFNNLKREGTKGEKEIKKVVIPLIVIYGGVCIGLTIVAPEIVQILATKEYYSAIYMMPPVAAGIYFTSLYNIYSNILLYYKKTKYIMIATVIAAVINLVLNYLLIPIFGFIAAAYTTLLAYIVLAVLQGLFVRKARNNAKIFDDIKIVVVSGIITIICLLCNFLYEIIWLRYGLIIIILLFAFWKRKYIMQFITNLGGRK